MEAGSYSLQSVLLEGPLGTLYLGTHAQTQEKVLLRVLRPELQTEGNALARLQALQRALVGLEPERSSVGVRVGGRDPIVPSMLHCGLNSDGKIYVAWEFVQGEPLTLQLSRHAGLPLPNKALRIGRQLASCLAVAHGAGIRHLALSPASVLLQSSQGNADGEQVNLLDLGVLDALGRPLIGSGVALSRGQLAYVAPEQRGDSGLSGPASDVFSLGVVLYELASGRLPQVVTSASGEHGRLDVAAQTGLLQMLPSWLQPFAALLERMLSESPAQRPSMGQVAALLQQLTALAPGTTTMAVPASAATPKFPTMVVPGSPSPAPARVSSPPRPAPVPVVLTPPVEALPAPVVLGSAKTPVGPAPFQNPAVVRTSRPPQAPAASPAALEPSPGTPAARASKPPRPATPPREVTDDLGDQPTLPPPVSVSRSVTVSAVAAPPTAAPTDVVEMAAEYTMSAQPTGYHGPAGVAATKSGEPSSFEFAPTHLSSDSVAVPQTGTGLPVTGGTPVEPGVGGITSLKPGQQVGNFRITTKIGQGGMGAVYAAEHQQIGRRAAVKVLHGPLAKTADYAARFLNEARAVNILRHPGLVEIFDFGQLSDGTLYIIMEFLEGESLRGQLRRKGTFSEAQARNFGLQIAQALLAAHQKGIIHRDLKPENVMVVADAVRPDAERCKILDFGIAKFEQSSKDAPTTDGDVGEFATAHGTTMGTQQALSTSRREMLKLSGLCLG